MPLPVSTREFVDELDTFDSESHVYLHRRTGEFFTPMPGDLGALEAADDGDFEGAFSVSDPEYAQKLQAVVESQNWLELPSKYDLNEYGIMEEFCETITDPTLAADLAETIGGRGTFGRWKGLIFRHNLQDQWYKFRAEALRRIAVRWLEVHDIPYRDE